MADVTDEYDFCCDDDWSVWRRFETWIWAILFLIQLSMIAFILIHGRKDKLFRSAFYFFFVAVTLVDCALALLRPPRDGFHTIFGAVYDYEYAAGRDEKTNETLSYPAVRAWISDLTIHVVVPIFANAQQLLLTAIAVNRFTAFAFPLRHAAMWRTRTTVVVVASLAAMSVLLGAAWPVAVSIQQAVKCARATTQQRKELGCRGATWAFEQVFMPTLLIAAASAICCVVSFLLNVGSVATLIALRMVGRLQHKGPELQLFELLPALTMTQAQLSELEKSKLIELVRPHGLLYDMSLKAYRDLVKKNEVWASIGEKLGVDDMDGQKAAKQWKNLVDTYRRNVNKMKSRPTGSASKDAAPRWVHWDAMGFMEKHIGTGESSTVSTIETAKLEVAASQNDLFAVEPEGTSSGSSTQPATQQAQQAYTPASKKFKRGSDLDPVEEKLVSLIELAQQQEARREQAHPVEKTEKELFGEMIAKKVKPLNDRLFTEFQVDVLNLIREKLLEQERHDRTLNNYVLDDDDGHQYLQLGGGSFTPLS